MAIPTSRSGATQGVAMSDEVLTSLAVTGDARLGNAATTLLSFHGATAVDQTAYTATISTTVPVSVAGSVAFAFQSSAQFIAQIDAINTILDLLIKKGLMAAS